MVAFAVKDCGGEIPRKDPRLLPDNMAEQAWNCDLSSGPLDGLPIPELVADLSGVAGTIQRAYRFPGPNPGDPDVWLPLPSPFSSVVRSPLADDTLHRLYWTNPGAGAFWSTYAMIQAGTPPYSLGIINPNPNVGPTVSVSGGTPPTDAPYVHRSYLYTYVDQYGQESAPSKPSVDLAGASDGVWTLFSLPTTAPSAVPGKNYPPITGLYLYRTTTGQSTGAQFYRVATFDYASSPPALAFFDTVPDTAAVGNPALQSASWVNPPDALDGLTVLPGGMLVGFTGNTVHFCEPNRPHAWPAGYDQSVQYQIVGFGVWQQSLVILTEGFPSTGSGTTPAAFTMSQVQVPEPCIARGSIITDLMGVYYASQNGLVMLNYYGMQNQTLSTLTKNIWLTDFHAENIIACRHRASYLAINGTGVGFLIDYSEARLGIMQLNTFNSAVCVWNDVYNGDAYIIADKKIYRWDSPDTGALNYRWRSKQFYLPSPASLGACQISLSTDVSNPAPIPNPVPPLSNPDPSLVLPDGINAVFRLFAGPGGQHKVYERNLTEPRSIFRLPGGFKAFDWQFEIVSRVPVYSIELASTMRELKGV